VPDYDIDALTERVGDSKVVVEDFVVEAGKVAEFAAALGDEWAGDLVATDPADRRAVPAPLAFVRTSAFPRYRVDGAGADPVFDLGFDPRYELHAEQAYEVDRPVYVGDVLTGEATLTDVYRREGDDADLTFAVEELAYRDGDDEPVLTERMTFVEALPRGDA
jgi:hypothetical protein